MPEATTATPDLLVGPAASTAPFAMPEATSAAPDPLAGAAGPVRFEMPDSAPGPRPGGFEAPAAETAGPPLDLALRDREIRLARRPVVTPPPPAPAPASATVVAALQTADDVRDTAEGLAGTAVATGVAFLPAPWRAPITARAILPMPLGGALSGLVEVAAGGACWVGGFARFINAITTHASAVAAQAVAHNAPNAAEAYSAAPLMAGTGWIAFLTTPLGFLGLYLIAEGLLRGTSALVTREVHGMLPLWIAERLTRIVRGRAAEAARGRRVADEVFGAGEGWDLKITSCRAKDWDALTTIAWQDAHYRLLRAESVAGAVRPHVYLLRKAADHDLIRRLEHFAPTDVLLHK